MKALRNLVAREPAVTLSIISTVAGAVCAAAGRAEYAPVLVAVAAAFLGLRTQVTPAGKARETAVQAARDAATQTAATITPDIAGLPGQVTDAAQTAVNDAVGLVSGLLGGKK